MNEQTANRWIVASAVVTLGVYFYRRLTEQVPASSASLKSLDLVGVDMGKPLAPTGQFVTAWGFTYLTVALIAQVAPGLGGAFAILIGAADLLANTGAIIADQQQNSGALYPVGTPTYNAIVAAGGNPNLSLSAPGQPNLFNTPTGPAPFKPPTNLPGFQPAHIPSTQPGAS